MKLASRVSNRVFAKSFLTVLISGAALVAPANARGQTIGTGSIQGTIYDASGSVLPGAAVNAANPATGYVVTQNTSAAGSYVLGSLPPGSYKVTVTASGFQTLVQNNVTVNALSTVGLDLHLNVGKLNQTVVVSAAPPQLNTSNGTLETTIPNSTYSALPLAMNGGPKSPMGFVNLMPGTAPGPFGINAINGGPGQSSFIYINGMPVITSELQGDARNINTETSTEVVDQFQVITSGVPAYYEGQGVTNFILKSGTNQFHGDVYENLRNTEFDARGFFAATTPVERQNEFGASIGGPIVKNKAFFFFNYDGWRYTAGANPSLYSLPTADERTGNFSALPVTIYDPASTLCSPGGTCSRLPFAGNVIPANRISNISKQLQSYLPATINSGLQNNFLGALTGGTQQNMFLGKADVSITQNNHLSFITQYGNNTPSGLGANGGPQLPLPYTSSRFGGTKVVVEQLSDTHSFTQNLVNVFGYQFNRFVTPFQNPTTGGNYATKAGLTGLPAGDPMDVFPPVSFGGPNSPTSWALNGYVQTFGEVTNTGTFQDNVQWVRGRHSFTFGGEIGLEQENTAFPSSLNSISFSNSQTAGFSPTGTLLTTTGNAYASYLLGAVASAGLNDTTVAETGARYRRYAVYAQDDWKVSPKFTVNLGLRYSIAKPFVEVHDRNSWFNPDLPNAAVSGYPGTVEFAGNGPASCHCSTQVQTHYLNFGPRVGFAYSPDTKTVFRGSFSIVHFNAGALGGNASSQGTGLLGYAATPSFQSPDAGITQAFNWDNGFPAYARPPFFDPTLNAGYNTATGPTGGGVSYNRPDTAGRSPYTENWNFTVERQLVPSTVWSLSYAGSGSRLLPVAGGDGIFSNQLNPRYLALGNLLLQPESPATLAQAQAILPGIALPYPNFAGSIGQMLRPFPQYAGIGDSSADFGTSSYNSLQTLVQRSLSRGLYVLGSYTWSREIDDSGGNAYFGASGAPRSAYNRAAERSVGTIDQPQVASVAFSYQLPFGHGHELSSSRAWVNELIGGWQLSGILSYSSGTPLGAIGASCNVPFTGGCYANYNPNFQGSPRINGAWGSGNATGSNATSYIDKNAFQTPPVFTFGDTPRTAPYNLRTPWSHNEDLSLSKRFRLRAETSLKLQLDAFNVFNWTVFGGINTDFTSAAFGTVSGQANAPRKLQLEAYIYF